MGRAHVVNSRPGLKTFRSGGPKTTQAPTPGSRTQRRKAELKTYNMTERQNGRNK